MLYNCILFSLGTPVAEGQLGFEIHTRTNNISGLIENLKTALSNKLLIHNLLQNSIGIDQEMFAVVLPVDHPILNKATEDITRADLLEVAAEAHLMSYAFSTKILTVPASVATKRPSTCSSCGRVAPIHGTAYGDQLCSSCWDAYMTSPSQPQDRNSLVELVLAYVAEDSNFDIAEYAPVEITAFLRAWRYAVDARTPAFTDSELHDINERIKERMTESGLFGLDSYLQLLPTI